MHLTVSPSKIRAYAFLIPYFIMILTGLLLPSDGNHGIMTPKSLAFLGSLFFFLVHLITREKISIYQAKVLSFSLGFGTFLLIWLFMGLGDDQISQVAPVGQFKIFVITLSFVIMTLYIANELLRPETLIKIMILTNFAYSIIKLTLIILNIFNVINLFAIMEMLDMRFMSMEMASGFSRFQTSVDIVTPFFILFVLQSDKLNLKFSTKFKYAYCLISIISIIFSFSRFLMGVAFLSGIFYVATLNKNRMVKAFLIIMGFLFLFVCFIGFDVVLTMIERRFFSNDNYYSDLTRTQQIDALLEQFFKAPYFGMGLGGYVKDFIRDFGILYSYEVQWVAFLMQFGIFGLLLLLVPVGYICAQFVLCGITRVKLSFLGLFLVWLLSGFTNPFLISLASGIVYSIFLLAALVLNRRELSHLSASF